VAAALNLFQATMLRWRSRHPYNAAHAARVPHALDADRLRATIAAALDDTGLTGYSLDAARGRYAWRGGAPDVPLEVAAAAPDPEEALRDAIQRTLSRRYTSDGAYTPFSFEAIPDGAGFWLLMGYDHVVAGGDSAVTLLGGICARYSAPGTLPRLERHPPRFRRMVVRHPLQVAGALAGMPRMAMRARRARRAPGLEFHDGTNAFLMRSLAPGVAEGIARAAERFGATRNDVLMAALIRALAGLKPPPAKGARRHEVAVASIVNIRSDCAAPASRTFGQFLSSFRASYPDPANASLEDVVRAVHAESRDLRTRRRYLRSLIAIALSGLAWRVVRDERRDTIYSKHYPVWSGLTTLVVPGLWNALVPSAERVPDGYRRGVSTGPPAPIVVAATFSGRALELGVSFRPAAVSAADVQAVVDRYVASLEALS